MPLVPIRLLLTNLNHSNEIEYIAINELIQLQKS